jgi:LPS export ABC transporter protein LptC
MLMSQDPYSLNLNLNGTSSPVIELSNVKEYKLDSEGTKVEASASRAERFNDRDILYDINVLMTQNNSTQTLSSNNATLIGNVIHLNGNVRYVNNGTVVTTEAVEYHQNKSMLIGKVPFKIERDNATVHGSSFSYLVKAGKFNAKNVKAIVQMEK